MNKFIVTYNFNVYKTSSLPIYERQKAFKLEIEANNETEARQVLLNDHNKNPFYFKFTKIN